MNSEMYSSLNQSSRATRPCKIKTYAVFKQLSEFPRDSGNLVVADNNTNKVMVSFNEQSNCEVVMFDKVLYNDVSQVDLYNSTLKSAVQDVMMGFNCFLVVFRLPGSSDTKPLEAASSGFKMDLIHSVVANMLKDLLLIIKNAETIDSSLYASLFEVHGDKVIDLLSNNNEYKDLKILDIPDEQAWIEVKDLVEKPIINEDDIYKLFSNASCGSKCFYGSHHFVLTATVVQKTFHPNGLEFLKTGKLTVIDFAECKNNYLLEETVKAFSADNISTKCEFNPFDCGSKLANFLKPAFGGDAKTTLITTLSSHLDTPEKDLSTLQFVSQAHKIGNYPEIHEKLIMPNSLKDYSEEIQELQKDNDAISSGSGVLLDNLMYRFYKMNFAVEEEELKILNKTLVSLKETVRAKKEIVSTMQLKSESLDSELKMEQEETRKLQLEMDKLKSDKRISQRLAAKVDEVIEIKSKRRACQSKRVKLMSELSKAQRNLSEYGRNIQVLRKKLVDLSNDADAEHLTLINNLISLESKINKVSFDFNSLKEVLFTNLKELSHIGTGLKTWHKNIKDLMSQFSLFIERQSSSFNSINQQIISTLSLHKIQDDVLDIVQNNKNEGARIISSFFHKIQALSDSAIKALRDIAHELEVIETIYKAEVKAIQTAVSSLSEGFKQFASEFKQSLKSYQQHFQEQESKVASMTDIIHYEHEFKKRFDDKVEGLKSALFSLKEMCATHTEATFIKWNEIQSYLIKSTEKYGVDKIMQASNLVQRETLKYCDNLARFHSNAAEQSPLEDKTENVENRLNQLLQMHEESNITVQDATNACEKVTEKGQIEVNKYLTSEKSEVEKDLKNKCLLLETNSRSFNDELKHIQHSFSCNRDDMKKNLDAVSLIFSNLDSAYSSCASTSNSILGKVGEISKIVPKSCRNYDSSLQHEITFDESGFDLTSTPCKQSAGLPVCSKSKETRIDLAAERNKLLQQIKSVAQQQLSQQQTAEKTLSEKSDVSDSESERKPKKGCNISTMSLPNLNSDAMGNTGARKKTFPKSKKKKSHKK